MIKVTSKQCVRQTAFEHCRIRCHLKVKTLYYIKAHFKDFNSALLHFYLFCSLSLDYCIFVSVFIVFLYVIIDY